MTTENPPTDLATDLARVLRELVAATIAARPYVEARHDAAASLLLDATAEDALELLLRLDSAIADAGDLVDEASS